MNCVGKEKSMEEEKKVVEETQEGAKTFDDILQDKTYQSEFDKRVAKALDTAKSKWEKEAEKQRTEAERLATMSAEEKHLHELSQANERASQAEARLNAYELKETALKIATERGIPNALLNVIDYTKENADTLNGKLNEIEEAYKQAVQSGINNVMKERTPKSVEQEVKTRPTNKLF